jgi:hypothetical protein
MANYSLDPTDPNLSLSDRLKLSRDMVTDPTLRAQLDQNYPLAPQPVSALPAVAPTGGAPTGDTSTETPTSSGADAQAQQMMQMFQELLGPDNKNIDPKLKKSAIAALDQLNPLKPKESIGDPTIGEFLTGKKNQGGILGTGIQPIDVLAFALAAGMTSRLPQAQAIATTMRIAQLPSQIRARQGQAVKDYLGAVQTELGQERQMAALKQQQQANAMQFMKFTKSWSDDQRRRAMLNMIKSGKFKLDTDEGRAAATEAGLTTAEIKAIHPLTTSKPGSVGAEAERQAQILGYPSYADVPTSMKPEIEAAIKKREDERIKQGQIRLDLMARAGERSQGRLDILNTKTLSNLVDINGRSALADDSITQSANPTQTAKMKGYHYLSEPRLHQYQASLIALTQLKRLEDTGEKLFKGVDKGANLGNAIALRGQAILGDAGVRGFQTLLLETLPSNAIASGMVAGRLSEKIITTIEKPLMPNMTDTYASFKEKIGKLRQRLKNNRDIVWGMGSSPEAMGLSDGGGLGTGNKTRAVKPAGTWNPKTNSIDFIEKAK